MHTHLIQIGNSKGIRIPKTLLEECQIKNDINITTKNNKIILESIDNARKGWDQKFLKSSSKDTSKKHDYIQSKFDQEEWQW